MLHNHYCRRISSDRWWVGGSRKYSYVVLYMSLTFAPIFIECSNSASVVNKRTVIEEKGGGSVRQSPVVQMVQPAVVLGACTVHTKVKSDVKHDNIVCHRWAARGRDMTGTGTRPRSRRRAGRRRRCWPSAPCRCRSGR